ncbi:dimethylargininase [bacterium]|nr:dimethylargininase [bacterium]
MQIAITRPVSESIDDCELTFMDRHHINLDKAIQQHAEYEKCLAELGCEIVKLPAEPELPDAVFVEDPAFVLDEIAIVAASRAENRIREIQTVEPVLSQYRNLEHLELPATLDGGDVVAIDKTVFVGRSSRTNDIAFFQLDEMLKPFGYDVVRVKIQNCLHLKTGCTFIGKRTVIANPDWVDISAFSDLEVVKVDKTEPWASNAIEINDVVICSSTFHRTNNILKNRGFDIKPIDISEFQKAEAGLTCMSLVIKSK